MIPQWNSMPWSVLIPELTGASLLIILGIVQMVLSFRAAGHVLRVLERIESPPERTAAARTLYRPVHGLRILCGISFLVAALTVAIPLYLHGLFQL